MTLKSTALIAALSSVLACSAFANTDAATLHGEITATSVPTGVNILATPINALPTPKTAVGNLAFMQTIIIPQTTKDDGKKLDVTLLDDFIDKVSPNARHYPTSFPNRTAQYQAKQIVEQLAGWLDPYASQNNASFEVLLRTAKINSIARNMDLGSDYAIRASTAIAKALKINPNHAEANFLYGMMLTEGGGFEAGEKYLLTAAKQGYIEAEQSLAQSDLLNDKRAAALARLQKLYAANPNHPQLAAQIDIVNNGGFYIWQLANHNINSKPSK